MLPDSRYLVQHRTNSPDFKHYTTAGKDSTDHTVVFQERISELLKVLMSDKRMKTSQVARLCVEVLRFVISKAKCTSTDTLLNIVSQVGQRLICPSHRSALTVATMLLRVCGIIRAEHLRLLDKSDPIENQHLTSTCEATKLSKQIDTLIDLLGTRSESKHAADNILGHIRRSSCSETSRDGRTVKLHCEGSSGVPKQYHNSDGAACRVDVSRTILYAENELIECSASRPIMRDNLDKSVLQNSVQYDELKHMIFERLEDLLTDIRSEWPSSSNTLRDLFPHVIRVAVFGRSSAMLRLLKSLRLAHNKRKIQIELFCVGSNAMGSPNSDGEEAALVLHSHGFNVTYINIDAVHAIAPYFDAAITSAVGVLANGTTVAPGEAKIMAQSIHSASKSFYVVVPMYKVCPLTKFNCIISNESSKFSDELRSLPYVGSTLTSIEPHLITAYLTDAGDYNPSTIFSHVRHNYWEEDIALISELI